MYVTIATRNGEELIRRTHTDRELVDRVHDAVTDDAKALIKSFQATTISVLTLRYELDACVHLRKDTVIKT